MKKRIPRRKRRLQDDMMAVVMEWTEDATCAPGEDPAGGYDGSRT